MRQSQCFSVGSNRITLVDFACKLWYTFGTFKSGRMSPLQPCKVSRLSSDMGTLDEWLTKPQMDENQVQNCITVAAGHAET